MMEVTVTPHKAVRHALCGVALYKKSKNAIAAGCCGGVFVGISAKKSRCQLRFRHRALTEVIRQRKKIKSDSE
jgi:hypothetical protein